MTVKSENVDLSALRIKRDSGVSSDEPKRGWLKVLIILIILALLIGGGYYLYPYIIPYIKPPIKVKSAFVQMTYPSQASSVLMASGYIIPQRKAAVASKGTGRLEYLGVEEGDKVKEGQVIARLEKSDIEARIVQSKASLEVAKAQIQQTEAEFEIAKRDFERKENLLKSKTISEAEFETAKLNYDSLQARLKGVKANIGVFEAGIKAAEVDLEYTIIRAPFDGTVLTKNADVGEIVAPFASSANSRGAVVTIADMSSLQLEADVSESNIERVKINQPCEIILDAYPDKRYRGVVWKIVPTADRAKATVLTKVKFQDIDERVLPDMSAKVNFLDITLAKKTESDNPKKTVPSSAVKEKAGRRVVFQIKEGVVKEVEIKTGERLGDQIEETSDLAVGERLVDKPADVLKDGDKVKVE